MTLKYIGLMSGTSADSIDAALISISQNGLFEQLLHYKEFPLPSALRSTITLFHAENVSITLSEFAELDLTLGHCFANAALSLLAEANIDPKKIDAIGSHGQTLFHYPDTHFPYTLQLGDPNTIAAKTGITTVADFRKMDMAAGGQGAPLAPSFHAAHFGDNQINRLIINLGGIANITYLPAAQRNNVIGFDTGPANALMDHWITQHDTSVHFDNDGAWGAQGILQQDLLTLLLSDPYFAKTTPKSTGREYFNLNWLKTYLDRSDIHYKAVDVQATLQHLTVKSLVDAITSLPGPVDEVIVCGGGAFNTEILKLLTEYLKSIKNQENQSGITLSRSDVLGIHPSRVEAIAFAWLAYRRLAGKPGNIPSVTGAKKPVLLGAIYA